MTMFSITGSQIFFANFIIFARNERIPVYRSQHYRVVIVTSTKSHMVSVVNSVKAAW